MIIRDEKQLRLPCEDVLPGEVGELVELLEKELANSARLGAPGVGLAANQVGIQKKIAIVRLGDIKFNLVNAKIEKGYDPAIFEDEGCLSVPGRLENTIRFQEVYVVNNLEKPHRFIASGLVAVVVQHELGHLNQELFIDRIAPKQTQIIRPSLKVGANDPCPCGKINLESGKIIKFKKCCGK